MKYEWKPRVIKDKTITEDQNKYVHDIVEKYKQNKDNLSPITYSFNQRWGIS
jgi:hypothetical protein